MAKIPSQKYIICIFIVAIAISVFFSISYLKLQTNIKERLEQAEAISSEYEDISAENKRLREFLNSGDDAKLIEEYARNRQEFVFPDEHVYYDVTPGNN